MPALNARPASQLDEWLAEITEALAAWDRDHPDRKAAPFAINQIVHKSNDRLDHDMQVCAKYKVPIVITSLGARVDVNDAVHAWGGVVLHDIINNFFAKKAIEKGADGLIAVAAGAGGHAGDKSPFALVQEIREWFDGPLALSGAIATGDAVLAAQAMGADFAYIGSAFIATEEARAMDAYKQCIVDSNSDDIVYSQPVHRRAWQLPEAVDPRRRPGPRPPARERPQQDELRRRRQEGLEGHLGLRAGHRRGQGRGARGRHGGAPEARVRGRRASAVLAAWRCWPAALQRRSGGAGSTSKSAVAAPAGSDPAPRQALRHIPRQPRAASGRDHPARRRHTAPSSRHTSAAHSPCRRPDSHMPQRARFGGAAHATPVAGGRHGRLGRRSAAAAGSCGRACRHADGSEGPALSAKQKVFWCPIRPEGTSAGARVAPFGSNRSFPVPLLGSETTARRVAIRLPGEAGAAEGLATHRSRGNRRRKVSER
jgi:NAD(P)H-dependent flavin oxidoreductase YrpB (nitropropane dioxygenase family)